MGETTVRNVQAQRKLREWSQRVAECRSSGLSVTQWCAEHEIKPKTYYNWQKKVLDVTLEQQRTQEEVPKEPERKFAELATPAVRKDLVAAVRFGQAFLEIYSGASAEVAAALCGALSHAE